MLNQDQELAVMPKKSTYPAAPILLVDDDRLSLKMLTLILEAAGINNLLPCIDSREASTILHERELELAILDLGMPHINGQQLLGQVMQERPELPVLVVTGMQEIDTAVACMKAGAFDYLTKPVEANRFLPVVKRAIELCELRQENQSLKKRLTDSKLKHPEAFAHIITGSKAMLALFHYLEAIAQSSQCVLITGETGVGKEMVAQAVHQISGRSGEFVCVNVAGLDDHMFADTLFGHKRGAYTGAEQARPGLIERAAGGTLFLDEIGDLAPTSQVKLLRLLQEGEYYPLGSDQPRRTQLRIVVATNRDLHAMQQDGSFRRDLYYRLCTHHVHLPPLRERLNDLPLLVEHFVAKVTTQLHRQPLTLPLELPVLLRRHDFPGNVRELQAMVVDAVSRSEGSELALFPFQEKLGQDQLLSNSCPIAASSSVSAETFPEIIQSLQCLPTLDAMENILVSEALRRSDDNRTQAATLLGVTRQTLHRWLRRQDSAD